MKKKKQNTTKQNKNKQNYQTVVTIPKSIKIIVERCHFDTPNTHIHDNSLFLLGTDTSITGVGVKLVLPPLLTIMIQTTSVKQKKR